MGKKLVGVLRELVGIRRKQIIVINAKGNSL